MSTPEQMALFCFPYAPTDDDDGLILPVIACTRRLLALPRATPLDMVGLARAIHALQRLPQPTTGVDVEYAFGFRSGTDTDFDETMYIVQIMPEHICFSTLFRTWNDKTGGDHNTCTAFEMDAGGTLNHMDDDAWAIALEWVAGLNGILENNAPKDILLDVTDSSASTCLVEGEP